jgi:hypothetical protein
MGEKQVRHKKIIATVGATGADGGGLARASLDDSSGEVACRVLTRKPDSRAAHALAEPGAVRTRELFRH